MRKEPRSIELLSPAKDLICGREAINHGADAVYIGAPKFGARAAAGNTLDDIRQLCDYAHLYSARIYVALNTILKEEELAEAEQMIWQLYEAGEGEIPARGRFHASRIGEGAIAEPDTGDRRADDRTSGGLRARGAVRKL